MSGKVILHTTGGELAGTKYRFDSPMLCFIGRGENCTILLNDAAGIGVSRRHCMLDIRPPHASIQDLGSRNGTFLNDINIGRGENDPVSGETNFPAHELKDGDAIQIGNNVFRVSLVPSRKCYVCHKILNDDYPANSTAGKTICPECMAAGLTHPVTPAAKTLRVRKCIVCGASVTLPEHAEDNPNYVCDDCRQRHVDPGSTFRIPDQNELGSNLFSLPHYKILKLLGHGGMGEVYLGQNLDTLEKNAIKVLRPEIAYFESCRDDFLREAENLRPLHHPNIVELRDFGEINEALYLVMEYCPGGTLRNYIRRRCSVLDFTEALDLAYQILDGLDCAHNISLIQTSFLDDSKKNVTGLVHRDIKPDNIFLNIAENVITAKISDFGLAKAFDMAGLSGCTRTGDFSGTLGFISKQQYLNYKYVRPEVDVWAAAATLYYMLTGIPPRDFSSGDPAGVFDKKPIPVSMLNRNIPHSVASVIDKALDDSETLFFKTAAALKFALMDAAKV